ncbi:LuxR C-terminal-related transcriptional regulator [Sphingomonas sp. H39-1-10]|uniref:helix-turn-helix transcriptional regulator n=1 Tax=Sphingomonas pollutisoli TaxID=3030829 RepID=UPI0023B90CFB|nr:LuxR C-terminal-related transcriptional regulator [Sphingomonas pollutisoli]MDF0490313.1 LuxR C-terminal-related transcriptional regulator [Sphingomonas pollutisoli]
MTTAQIDPTRLSELIGLIYDAAIDTTRWPIAMEAIRAELNCANSALTLQKMPKGEFLVNVATNIPQHYIERMTDYPADVLELWGGADVLIVQPISEPLILSRINPIATNYERSTNRYSLEWAKPQGLSDVIAISLARDVEALGAIAFARHVDAGPIGEREEQIVRLLIPHLQRAATINRMLDLSAIAKATFEAAIDTLTIPVLLADDLMQIVYANPAARRMLERGDLIREQDGRLSAATKPVTRALEVAVERAAADVGTLGRSGLGIPVRREGGAIGAVHVLPLRQGAALAPRAVVAIFVAHTGTAFVAPTEIVAALFALTPAESRVFDHIVAGQTVSETAAALGVEASTVKTHLLRVYEKTGVRRRSELQQMASALSLPIAA